MFMLSRYNLRVTHPPSRSAVSLCWFMFTTRNLCPGLNTQQGIFRSGVVTNHVHSFVCCFLSETLYIYPSEAIWGSKALQHVERKSRTCDSGQVLYSGGLSSSCLSHQENWLPFGYTHCQLFQQHSRGTRGSKRLVVPVHGDEKHLMITYFVACFVCRDCCHSLAPQP